MPDKILTLVTTEDDTTRLLKGSLLLEAEKQSHNRTHSRLTVSYGILLEWLVFFENDFENSEDQTFERMQHYLITVDHIKHVSPLPPYRERMVERVKEVINRLPWDKG